MGQETSRNSGTYFYVKAKNLKPKIEDYPKFALQQKNQSSGKYETVNEVTALTGWITSIEKVDKPKTDQFKRIRGVKFTLSDPTCGETYIFELPYSNPTRELINRMASLENFLDELRISFYRNRETGFCGSSLKKKQGDVKVETAYKYEEHIKPRIKIVQVGGENVSDYDKVDSFFDELIERKLKSFKTIELNNSTTPQYNTEMPAPQYQQYYTGSNNNVAPETKQDIFDSFEDLDLPF